MPDGEVMLAYAMNGEQLPLLNGFPLRLWCRLVLDLLGQDAVRHRGAGQADDQYWMKTAYRIPDVPGANIKPGQTGFKTVPINRMVPRAFVTNLRDGAQVAAGSPWRSAASPSGAIAGSGRWRSPLTAARRGPWKLGADEGPYSFRRFEGDLRLRGRHPRDQGPLHQHERLAQPMERVWNGAGFMQNGVETMSLHIA